MFGLARRELAETICEHWGWVTATGTNKVTACLSVLEYLEENGILKLPVKRRFVAKESLEDAHKITDIDSVMHMGIVKWRNEWWLSGIRAHFGYNADFIAEEKRSIDGRNSVSFLDYEAKNIYRFLSKQRKAFEGFTGGSRIVFMPADEIDQFLADYIEYFNKSLKLSAKEKAKAKRQAKEFGFNGVKPSVIWMFQSQG